MSEYQSGDYEVLLQEKNCDMVAVTGEECLQLIPGLVVADYVR